MEEIMCALELSNPKGEPNLDSFPKRKKRSRNCTSKKGSLQERLPSTQRKIFALASRYFNLSLRQNHCQIQMMIRQTYRQQLRSILLLLPPLLQQLLQEQLLQRLVLRQWKVLLQLTQKASILSCLLPFSRQSPCLWFLREVSQCHRHLLRFLRLKESS